MPNHDFVLRSGAKLHLTTAPFEPAIALTEVVTEASRGLDPAEQIDVILLNPKVRAAVYPLLPWAMWDGIHQLSISLMDDPKIGDRLKADWLEIASKIIEVNTKVFFSTTSSRSTIPDPDPKDVRGSPSA